MNEKCRVLKSAKFPTSTKLLSQVVVASRTMLFRTPETMHRPFMPESTMERLGHIVARRVPALPDWVPGSGTTGVHSWDPHLSVDIRR